MSATRKRRAAPVVTPKRRTADEIFVAKIVASVPIYKHHPTFPRAVEQAKNLVMNYLRECRELYPDHWVDPVEIGNLEDHDCAFIERLANALHSARLERSFERGF